MIDLLIATERFLRHLCSLSGDEKRRDSPTIDEICETIANEIETALDRLQETDLD
jgi:hypothetical protein